MAEMLRTAWHCIYCIYCLLFFKVGGHAKARPYKSVGFVVQMYH